MFEILQQEITEAFKGQQEITEAFKGQRNKN